MRVPIEISLNTRFHLILVAHGASEACCQMFGGSGSLILDNRVKGFANHTEPFVLGDLDGEQTFIHILDDNSLDVLLQNRDTITDFTNYLIKREQFLRSGVVVYSPGEEEHLAYYLKQINEKGEHDFIMPDAHTSGYAFAEGT